MLIYSSIFLSIIFCNQCKAIVIFRSSRFLNLEWKSSLTHKTIHYPLICTPAGDTFIPALSTTQFEDTLRTTQFTGNYVTFRAPLHTMVHYSFTCTTYSSTGNIRPLRNQKTHHHRNPCPPSSFFVREKTFEQLATYDPYSSSPGCELSRVVPLPAQPCPRKLRIARTQF